MALIWERHPNGIMKVYGTVTKTLNITTASGQLYYSYTGAMPFPVPFSAVPFNININASSESMNITHISAYRYDQTGVTEAQVSCTSSRSNNINRFDIMAVGLW